MKYQTWASEKFIDPGNNPINHRLPYLYENLKFNLVGNFNGIIDENGIPIKSLANLTLNKDSILTIYTIESRGYKILNPLTNYSDPRIVNHQEGLNLESAYKDTLYKRIDTIRCITPNRLDTTWYYRSDLESDRINVFNQYTTHPTIRRFIDNAQIFNNTNNLKLAVSGNFFGDTKDELMLIYDKADSAQKFIVFKNNRTDDSLNYTMSITWDSSFTRTRVQDSIAINQLIHAVSGDFDGDGYDEVALLSRFVSDTSHNKIHMLDWDRINHRWNINLVMHTDDWMWCNASVLKTAVGDFDGNGSDEIAVAYTYGIDSNTRQRIFVSSYSSPNMTFDCKLDTILGKFDFRKISHMTAGNYNGDTSTTGHKIDELAMFYYNSNVQSVYVTDHSNPGWKYSQVIKEHISNIQFNPDTLKFVFSGNFDRDIKKRDDLGCIYLGKDSDDQDFSYSKVLMWISLPTFSENDFIMDTLRIQGADTISGKFIPMGLDRIRLVSDPNAGNLQLMDPSDSVRIESFQYLNFMNKYFNTLMPWRITFTDKNESHWRQSYNHTYYSNSIYDYWKNSIDSGYVIGLRNYLDSAYKYKFKVIPFIDLFDVENYNRNDSIGLTFDTSDYYMQYNDFSNSLNIPNFFYNILNDSIIKNHSANLCYYIYDEPDNIIKDDSVCGDVRWWGSHFARSAYKSLNIYSVQTPMNIKSVSENFYCMAKNLNNKSLIGNFNNLLDFIYYGNNCDITGFDSYPINPSSNKIPLNFLVVMSGMNFQNAVRNNKTACFTWTQGSGAESNNYGTPRFEMQRFSLFSQAIEGARGFLLFDQHQGHYHNDTTFGAYLLAVSEFNNYIPIFYKEPLTNRVSTNHDRNNILDWGDMSCGFETIKNDLNHALFYDNSDSIYYLFVSYMGGYPVNKLNVNFTVFVDSNSSNKVYLLSHDYFKNNQYRFIESTIDNDNKFISYSDNFNSQEIKIYTIGGLPSVHTKADSIGLKGYLEFSNQRKLIAYPKRQNSIFDRGSTDTLRYHAVYHRKIPGTNRYGVYYRRSNPMVRMYPQELINWEANDFLISGSIRENGFVVDNETDCMYPSIIVRYDYTNSDTNQQGPKVYVVYTCKSVPGDNCDNYIVENIFNANDSNQSVTPYGNIIAEVNGFNKNNWGTPVINASYNGNYYAWSDEKRGIVAGWKAPHQINFTTSPLDTINIHWGANWNSTQRYLAQHPSLNSYSRLHLQENDCSLVWQEKDTFLINPPNDPVNNNIYMTRLRLDQENLINYFGNNFIPQNDSVLTNSNNTIAKLTDSSFFSTIGIRESILPVIYRGIEDIVNSPIAIDTSVWIKFKRDRIYWQNIKSPNCYEYCPYDYSIFTRSVNFTDTNSSISVLFPFRIIGFGLFNPNVSQGSLNLRNFPNNILSNDSIIVLNINEYVPGCPLIHPKIWQLNHSYNGFFGNPSKRDTVLTDEYSIGRLLIGEGRYPNLSAMPTLRGRGEWLANRRIYETGDSIPPEIVSSLQLFYKRKQDYNSITPFFGYISSDGFTQISNFWILDSNDHIKKLFINNYQLSGINMSFKDTIYSSWINFNEIQDIGFLGVGNTNSKLRVLIERQRDSKIKSLNLSLNNDSVIVTHLYKILSSKKDNFRIIFIKNDQSTKYFETVYLGILPFNDEFSFVENGYPKMIGIDTKNNILDFRESTFEDSISTNLILTCLPNPSSDFFYLTGCLPISSQYKMESVIINFSIYNLLGEKIGIHESKAGETIVIPANVLPEGILYIRAEIKDMNLRNKIKSVVKSILHIM